MLSNSNQLVYSEPQYFSVHKFNHNFDNGQQMSQESKMQQFVEQESEEEESDEEDSDETESDEEKSDEVEFDEEESEKRETEDQESENTKLSSYNYEKDDTKLFEIVSAGLTHTENAINLINERKKQQSNAYEKKKPALNDKNMGIAACEL